MSGTDEKPEIIARKRHSLPWKLRIGWAAQRAARTPGFAEREFTRFREGLGGTFPAPEGPADATVLMAACNELYYWRFAVTLVLSIETHGRPQSVHLHLCRPSPAMLDHIDGMRAALRHVALSWTTDACVLAEGLPYRTIYLTSARFLAAPLVQEATGRAVLCVDVDSIANAPIGPAYAPVLAAADLALVRRPEETSPSRKVRADAVGLNATEAGTRFTAALGRALAWSIARRPHYHVDQMTIHFLSRIMARTNGLRVADMPPALSDTAFSPDGVLWMAKGWTMKDSAIYGREKARIDALFPTLSGPAAAAAGGEAP